MRKIAVTAIWIAAIAAILFNATELSRKFYEVAESAPQQAAIAAYHTGMMVGAYALARAFTDIMKETLNHNE